MNSKTWTRITALALLALAIPVQLASQQSRNHDSTSLHRNYKLIDLGTFGGPASYVSNGADGILNNQGTAAGWGDTATPDPFPSFCFDQDCFVSHGFQWRNGVLTDLGTLADGWSSQVFWISGNGNIAGISQNGEFDPLIGIPEFRAVLWQNGGITDLGTLGGGYEAFALAVNNGGQVAGFSLNTVPDPFCLFAPGLCNTQTRAFLWQNGVMQDLGTLGGDDAIASFVNQRGQVTGQSYTSTTANRGSGLPTTDPFLWENGTMQDLGGLGGTFGNPTSLNSRGQVVGISNLSGDLATHPFLWTKRRGMQDLGTLGGSNGESNWINDAGEIAGKADLPGPSPQNHDAVLWKNGLITDLGTLPGDSCSNAYQVNSSGQVVGTSEDQTLCAVPTGEHAFLWENGGPMVDLNTLIPSGSSLQLTFAFAINDRGEILGTGLPAGCTPENISFCGHAFVLVPCTEGDENCVGGESETAMPPNAPIKAQRRSRSWRTNRYPLPGVQAPSR